MVRIELIRKTVPPDDAAEDDDVGGGQKTNRTIRIVAC